MQLVVNRPKDWPALREGDSIYLISPAWAANAQETVLIEEMLEDWQIKPIFYEYTGPNSEPFLSHSDEERLKELEGAIYGDKSDFVLCVCGGYGSARLLPHLLKSKKPSKGKVLIGFSDITSLHLMFNNHWHLPTLHSPMAKQCATGKVDKQSIDYLKDVLFARKNQLTYKITPLNEKASAIKSGTELQPLIGGNLSLIQTSIATQWAVDSTSKYSLLIEEVDEKGYAIDRMLRHLVNAGIFKNCQALFISDISENPDENNEFHLEHIIDNFIDHLDIPIFSIPNIGHKKSNLAIPLGYKFSIER